MPSASDILDPKVALRQAVAACRRAFVGIGLFSACINLLMLASPLYMLQVYDRVLATQNIDTLLMLTLMVTVAFLVMAGLEAVRSRIMTRAATWLDRQLSGPVLGTTIEVALLRGGSSAQGLRDLDTVRNFLGGGSLFPLFDAPWVPIYLAVVFLMHPVLGWVATIGAAILFGLAVLNDLWTRQPLRQANTEAARRLNAADAAVRNADVIAAMGLMPNLLRIWQAGGDSVLGLQAKASDRAGAISAFAKFVRLALQSAMLGAGAYLVIQQEMTGGVMIAASIIMGRAVAPVEQSIGAWKSLIAAQAAYRRVKSLIEQAPSTASAMSLPRPKGALSIERLTYVPPGTREAVIKGASFALNPGEALGLIGPSGAGKTMLARLVVGSLTPTQGHVRLDGAEMTVWNAGDRGRHVGYLPQDVELFNGTIRENIARLGEAPDEAVVRAAQLAGVHELALKLPQGYDTLIGPGGLTLSGGQRQRIGLARAVFGDPRLVVLDEPNSNLDAAGEQALLETIARLKEAGTTLIVSAHRPSLLVHMDKMLVIRDGAVDLFGARDEVMAKLTRPAAVETARPAAVETARPGPRPVIAGGTEARS